MEFVSGSTGEFFSGATAEFVSGSTQDVVGQAVDVEADLDPPAFGDLAYEAGSTAINFECSTDRPARVQFRARRWLSGAMTGPWFYSVKESEAVEDGHAAQISGLSPSTDWRVFIAIDASDDHDLAWTEFTDGMLGPVYRTAAKGITNPVDPN